MNYSRVREINEGSQPGLAQPRYRGDVDGLRALAVIAVVIYHYFGTRLPGGFVGVDVFFVISGYLISSIVLSGHRTGTFCASRFYVRRGLRLFPALSTVLLASFLMGWACLLPDDFQAFGKHLWNAVTFTINISFWQETGYFDAASELKPLLHLWSLAIEEQFYLIWPVLLGAFAGIGYRYLVAACVAVIASFILNLIWVGFDGAGAFFLLHTRLWELGAGGLLAGAHLAKQDGSLRYDRIEEKFARLGLSGRVSGTATGLIGMFLIFSSFAFISDKVPYPGMAALLPVTGTLMIIAAGPGAWTNRAILSQRVLMSIGRISYPLYLWHWPILSFFTIIHGSEGSIGQRLLLITAALMLSLLTYVLIERPLRFGKGKRGNFLVLAGVMLCIAALGVAAKTGRIRPRSAAFGLEKLTRAAGEWTFPAGLAPDSVNGRTVYTLGNVAGPTVLFAGDSNMQMYSSRIERLEREQAPQIPAAAFLTSGGCLPVAGVTDQAHPECNGLIIDLLDYARRPQVKTVVIAAQWYGYFAKPSYSVKENGTKFAVSSPDGQKLVQARLKELLKSLASMGKTTYLILGIPVGDELDPKKMVKRSLIHLGFSVNLHGLSKEGFLGENENRNVRRLLIEAAQDSGAIVIDPLDYLCGPVTCPSVDANGEPEYKDAYHLRPTYVSDQVSYLDRTLK